MTTENWVDHWPNETTRTQGTRTYFAPVEATVEDVREFYGKQAFKFVVDDSFVVSKGKRYKTDWMFTGEHVLRPGDRVKATLSASKGEKRTFYDVDAIELVERPESAPASTESAASPARAPEGQRDETRASIEKQTAFKGQTEVVCALLSRDIGGEKAAFLGFDTEELSHWQKMRDALWSGEEAKADNLDIWEPDFDPEDSPLVRAAQAMGGEVTEVE